MGELKEARFSWEMVIWAAVAGVAALALVVGVVAYLENTTEYQVMSAGGTGLHSYQIQVETSGTDAGNASGTGYSARGVNGEVRAIRVDFEGGISMTTDIDIVGMSDDYHPEVTLYDKDNTITDTWVYPVAQRTSTAGDAVSGEYDYPLVAGLLQVDVISSTAIASSVVTVTVYVWE